MERTTAEYLRLHGSDVNRWRKWGPYLSDRAWGTVREDYSESGDAWGYLPHDLARSKTFRWGEDGIAGWCDRYQILSWGLALWNERDPILKERYFGLVPAEGNHGEDVKEYYFYVDALPSHAYMRMIYKYPQQEYPYAWLIDENRNRGGSDPEFELIDTGIFDENRYFDVEIEIAKDGPDTVVFRVTAHNRGPDAAPIHLIPQSLVPQRLGLEEQTRDRSPRSAFWSCLTASGHSSPTTRWRRLSTGCSRLPPWAAPPRCLRRTPSSSSRTTRRTVRASTARGHSREARTSRTPFTAASSTGRSKRRNPEMRGTKSCAHIRYMVPPGESAVMRMRLTPGTNKWTPLESVDKVIAARKAEADEFYSAVQPAKATAQEKLVQRQAFAGMIWSKQSYLFDVDRWLDGDNPDMPPPDSRKQGRNKHWRHLNSMRMLSMPDKWEYPWFAAWDLAFHMIPFARIDSEFAKEQLWLMLFEQFQHPNGQIPAYEWEFSDLNPPVHAWAVWRVYNMDRIQNGKADTDFLEKCFHKLLINFTWWVNKVDREGNNVFEGGFLGLDNITVIDRSEPLPQGASLEQSDATGWMGMYCLVMMRIALELAKKNAGLRGARDEILRALRLHRRRDEDDRATVGRSGIERTDSSTTCSASRTGITSRSASARSSASFRSTRSSDSRISGSSRSLSSARTSSWFMKYRREIASTRCVDHGATASTTHARPRGRRPEPAPASARARRRSDRVPLAVRHAEPQQVP